MNKIKLIDAGLAIDDRGELIFSNDFDMSKIKRFYQITNHQNFFVRAWHGHQKEEKFILVSKGSAIIAGVKIDNWKKPSKDLPVEKFIVTEKNPKIVHIPAGYANGFKTLAQDTKLIIFSTSTLKESKNDDFRYDSRHWNPWDIEER